MLNSSKDANKLGRSYIADTYRGSMQHCTLVSSLLVSFKSKKNRFTKQHSNCILWHLSQRNGHLFSCRNLYMNIPSSFIVVAKILKLPKCSLMDKGLNKLQYYVIKTTQQKQNKILLIYTKTWINLKNFMLSKKTNLKRT